MAIDVDALLALSDDEVKAAFGDIEAAIGICDSILVDADATATNRLKCIELKFQLLVAKGRMSKLQGETASAEIVRLERLVHLLASQLTKYDSEYVTRCMKQ